MGERLTGTIIKGIGGFYYVDVPEHGLYECRARGVFRNRKLKPLVGDIAVVETEAEKKRESTTAYSGYANLEKDVLTYPSGYVVEIKERKNELLRPAAANIDQAILVFAVAQPAPNFNLLDRFTVMMEKAGIELVLCFNKSDLADEKERERLQRIYRAAGFPVYFISAKEQIGIEALRACMQGKTTVLAGPSGVGKSTTVNLLAPGAQMEIGQISKKIERGKHTTRHSELFVAGEYTYVLDTPGFSTFYLEGIEADELRFYFPELLQEEGKCRFQGCLHLKEPDCRVKELLVQGVISAERYHNYELLYEELKHKKKY